MDIDGKFVWAAPFSVGARNLVDLRGGMERVWVAVGAGSKDGMTMPGCRGCSCESKVSAKETLCEMRIFPVDLSKQQYAFDDLEYPTRTHSIDRLYILGLSVCLRTHARQPSSLRWDKSGFVPCHIS